MIGKRKRISKLAVMLSVCLMICGMLTGCVPQSNRNLPKNDVKSIGMNLTVSGAYGVDKSTGLWMNYASMENAQYGMAFKECNDRLFAKNGEIIYEIVDGSLVELYRHEAQIHYLIGVTEEFVLFDSPVKIIDEEEEKFVDQFWIYYFESEETVLLTETGNMRFYYDDKELIITDDVNGHDKWFAVYSNLDGEIQETICANVEELPDNYEIYTRDGFDYAIEKKKKDGTTENTNLTYYERNYAGEVVQAGGMTSQHRGNVAYKAFFYTQRVSDTTVYNLVRRYNSDWDEIYAWDGDVIEKYDIPSRTGTVIFEDDENAIIGYDYNANKVYEIVLSSYTLRCRDLNDPGSFEGVIKFSPDKKIAVSWVGQYLFWVYPDDAEDIFGGVIKL